jgi:hypothetical protein
MKLDHSGDVLIFKTLSNKLGNVHMVYCSISPFYLIMSKNANFSEKEIAFSKKKVLRFSLKLLSENFSFLYRFSEPPKKTVKI